jgi:C4-dicarboxylate-specific signal transduction histidine kinase
MRDQVTHASKNDENSDPASPLSRIGKIWGSLKRKHGGIGLRLLGWVFLYSSVVTLLLTLLQLYLDYRRDVSLIDRRITEIEGSYRWSISEGLWNLDVRQLELQVDGILHLPDIRYVEVRESTDRAAPLVLRAGSHQADSAVRREFEIFHTHRGVTQRLGVLSIEATLNEVYGRLLETAIIIMVSQGVRTFLVSFFILFIVHQLITRHLAAMAKSLSGHDLRRSPPRLQLARRPPAQPDELDHLVSAFNDVCADLQTAHDELREGEQQLAHANRLATMGQLTASIANEVNQPVAAIVVSADAALLWLRGQQPDLEKVRQALERISKDGHRAGHVIGRIRELIERAPPRRDWVVLNDAIVEVTVLARNETTRHGVSVRTQFAPDLPLIRGDRIQLQQVVLNLIMNAVQAMSQSSEDRRELLISTETEADRARVTVRDSGPGMSEAALEQAFTAFYTTKSSGLGVGLSICRSIVEAHGGRLWADANAPRGAAFHFTVPIHSDPHD